MPYPPDQPDPTNPSGSSHSRWGERLVSAGIITPTQLELAGREQRRRQRPLDNILVELGFVSANSLSTFLAGETGVQVVELRPADLRHDLLSLVPLEVLRRCRAIPVGRVNGTLTVAMADPLNITAIDTLRQVTGLHIEVTAANEVEILELLDQYAIQGDALQESIDRAIQAQVDDARGAPVEEATGPASTADDAPIIQLVNQVIERAVKGAVSDIHFEPEEKLMRIRTRLDGVLRVDLLIPKSMQAAVTARLKIMGGMDVSETRLPQDGRAAMIVSQRPINLRLSSLPCAHGEKVVVRILDGGSQSRTMAALGLAPDVQVALWRAVSEPHGVVIVTGPTGSGKSTTLYAVLNEISTIDVSVFTLEDPVEYRLNGICQTQVREDIGLTFSAGLRTLLRQDPDIILVGETRDTESAQLMVRAALTGHLVLTTLHTNDAPGAIPRLLDMGVEPYLLPDSLLAVLAQRLVRVNCPSCRVPVEDPEKSLAAAHGLVPPGEPRKLLRGRGCSECCETGYRGRQGIFELMVLDERFHEAIIRRAGAPEYARLAREGGMRSMLEDGLRRAFDGSTTVEEVLRVTRLAPA